MLLPIYQSKIDFTEAKKGTTNSDYCEHYKLLKLNPQAPLSKELSLIKVSI